MMDTPAKKRKQNRAYYWTHRAKILERRRRWDATHPRHKAMSHEQIVAQAIEEARKKEEAIAERERNIEQTRSWWGAQNASSE